MPDCHASCECHGGDAVPPLGRRGFVRLAGGAAALAALRARPVVAGPSTPRSCAACIRLLMYGFNRSRRNMYSVQMA